MANFTSKFIRMSKYLGLLLLTFFLSATIYSQDPVIVKRSSITETIDGEKFYIHFVEKGQNNYAVCKAYLISLEELIKHNPEVTEGLQEGMLLSIPYNENPKAMDKEEIAEPQDPDYFYHIVKKQETLFGLSQQYNIRIEKIKEINPELEEYPRIGQILKIPKVVDKPENFNNTGNITHVVNQGETLYRIAKIYGLTVGQIKNMNQHISDQLSIGQVLYIPDTTTMQEESNHLEEDQTSLFIEHHMNAGETLYSLARKYAIGLDSIIFYNPDLETDNIAIGEVIRIPNRKRIRADYIYHRSNEDTRLKEIAKQYEIAVDEIKEVNPGVRNKIKDGTLIKIPVDENYITAYPEITDDSSSLQKPEISDVFAPCKNLFQNRKNVYNVALMIPLYLEEALLDQPIDGYSTNRLSSLNSLRFFQFYQGFLMAADSLAKQGLKLNLFVYDVDNSDAKVLKVLSASELSQMDLIIGPFYKKSFEMVSDFAKLYHIKIINPLSSRNEVIEDNPFVYKVKPTRTVLPELLATYLKDRLEKSNVVFIRKTQYKFQEEVDWMKARIQSEQGTGCYIRNDQLYAQLKKTEGSINLVTDGKNINLSDLKANPSDSTYFSYQTKDLIIRQYDFSELDKKLSLARKNIIIIYAEDKAFVKELIGRLNMIKDEYSFELYGMPENRFYDEVELDFLQSLNFHSFTSSNIYYNRLIENGFIEKFRDIYLTDPAQNQYAFDGFDIGWFFLNAMFHYGINFEACLENMQLPLIQNEFDFVQQPNGGYINHHWQLIRLSNYQTFEINY